MNIDVHAADIQDRDGAETLLRQARRRFPFVERIVADRGYAGAKMRALVARTGAWELQIVKRADVGRFVVLPKRWIVERTLGWISRNRRLEPPMRSWNNIKEREDRLAVAAKRSAAIATCSIIRVHLRA